MGFNSGFKGLIIPQWYKKLQLSMHIEGNFLHPQPIVCTNFNISATYRTKEPLLHSEG